MIVKRGGLFVVMATLLGAGIVAAQEDRSPNDGCDPNYASACVPIAGDVDCADGPGNGPAYVRGPVAVIGEDIYELDRDRDGIGCVPLESEGSCPSCPKAERDGEAGEGGPAHDPDPGQAVVPP